MTIAAITTEYAGCRFRSRLEARWAVFFDSLQIGWEYEPDGYQVGPDGRRYLPDFYLLGLGTWVEVKGDMAALDLDMIAAAVDPLHGLPRANPYNEISVLLLGPLPQPDAAHLHWVAARSGYCEKFCACQDVHYSQVMFWPMELPDTLQAQAIELGMGAELHQCGRSVLTPPYKDLLKARPDVRQRPHGKVLDAYRAARSARFEHGEKPEPPKPDTADGSSHHHPAISRFVSHRDWYRRARDGRGDVA